MLTAEERGPRGWQKGWVEAGMGCGLLNNWYGSHVAHYEQKEPEGVWNHHRPLCFRVDLSGSPACARHTEPGAGLTPGASEKEVL